MSGVELLPCPFCGAPGKFIEEDETPMVMAMCGADCELVPATEWRTRDDATRLWNTRTPAQGLDAATIERCARQAFKDLMVAGKGLALAQFAADSVRRVALNTASTTTRGEDARLREALEANQKGAEALAWALAEIGGSTRYNNDQQRENCIDLARNALDALNQVASVS